MIAPARLRLLELQMELERQLNGPGFMLSILLDLDAALCLVANLQLALRHSGNNGFSSEVAKGIIGGLIDRFGANGCPAHAELAELGNNPENDT